MDGIPEDMMGLINPDDKEQIEPVVPVDEADDKHCFPYYDFGRSLGRRFDKSFLLVLILQNFNYGLWILV